MNFTHIFIKRPVLATVISLIILILGLRSIFLLPVRKFPEITNAVIRVTTFYPGANADLVAGFITTPLEKEIAAADGIDYLQSSSSQGVSSITATLKLNYNPNAALAQIISKVNAVKGELPKESEEPVIDVETGDNTASMYISFYSESMDSNQITDYLTRVVRPKLLTVSGIQEAEILGSRKFAMRIWLDPQKMSAYNISPQDVWDMLGKNNYLSSLGRTKGSMISINLDSNTQLKSEEEFKRLIVKRQGTSVVRLSDISDVVLGAEDYTTYVSFDGRDATFIGITVQPTANPLVVNKNVWKAFPEIQKGFPEGLNGIIVYDSTDYINDSIKEVIRTLVEAVIIVIFVIFLFLGSIRSVLIPAVTIPLSLVGGAFIMYVLGYSLHLLTLLSLVLAIGIVVDDAIVVLENVHRHIEEGKKPLEAAFMGAKELFGPIIAMTLTLAWVYVPIGFMEGLTGQLFSEFAFTLVGCVIISGIVAITLSPMMCSRLLKPHEKEKKQWLSNRIDRDFERLRSFYQRSVADSLKYVPVTMFFAVSVLVSCYFLYNTSQKELAPPEDQGFFIAMSTGDASATTDQMVKFTNPINKIFSDIDAIGHYFNIVGISPGGGVGLNNAGLSGVILKPWSDRTLSQQQILDKVQQQLHTLSGVQSAAFSLPALPGGGMGLPVQFVITTTASNLELYGVSQQFLKKVMESQLFFYAESDLKYDMPMVTVLVDREKVADLGLTMADVGDALSQMLGGGYVNRFSIEGYSYKVIPQTQRISRLNPQQLNEYYIKTGEGMMVPLSTVIRLEEGVQPEQLKHFQQLNSAIIGAVPGFFTTMGTAYNFLNKTADEVFPKGYSRDYAGELRQYVQEGSGLLITFFFALLIIFLVLAAQFESFRDPLIILITVPLSTAGALMFISLGFSTLNIYTEVGLVTLIGLISKNGILIVQFANQLQSEGIPKIQAIAQAAGIRLRPILMTTAATVLGVFPLLIASGAGARSRFDIGLVITAGMSIGTLFTLYVVPAMYMVFAKDLSKTKKV